MDKIKSRDGSSSGKASALPGSRPPRRADSIRYVIVLLVYRVWLFSLCTFGKYKTIIFKKKLFFSLKAFQSTVNYICSPNKTFSFAFFV